MAVGLQPVHVARVPAGVHHPQAGQVQPQRQGLEPADDASMGCRILADLGKKRAVLCSVFFSPTAGPRAQVVAGPVGVGGVPADGVELVTSSTPSAGTPPTPTGPATTCARGPAVGEKKTEHSTARFLPRSARIRQPMLASSAGSRPCRCGWTCPACGWCTPAGTRAT